MEDAYAIENPYAPINTFKPFAGREDAYARLQNHLNNPNGTSPPVFIGRVRIGKTALLINVPLVFGESYLVINLSLKDIAFTAEIAWLSMLTDVLINAAELRGFLMPHQPDFPDEDATADEWRSWLRDVLLPYLTKGIRPQRQFVIAMDDAQVLIETVRAATLPNDTFAYLQTLLAPQLGMAFTLDEAYESAIHELAPLVNSTATHRLGYLPASTLEAIFLRPVQGQYVVDAEAMNSIYLATGGAPAMIQRFGFYLYERITEKRSPFGQLTATLEDVKAVRDQVYAEWSPEYQRLWTTLTLDDRLFLTALGSVYYDDPVSPIGIERIAAWLIETDYPLDTTTISAVFRGLEYEGIIEGNASAITFTSDLFRRWILQNARMERTSVSAPAPSTDAEDEPTRWMWVLIAAAILLLIAALLALSLGNGGSQEIVPTVTLLPQG